MSGEDAPPFGFAYWNEVVGDNWPQISPGQWDTVANAFAAASQQIDPAAAPAAALRVSRSVRSSARLQQPIVSMEGLATEPETFQKALGIANQAFAAVAAQVANLRYQLEKIAGEADTAITADLRNDKGLHVQAIIDGYAAEADYASAQANYAIAILPEFGLLAKLLGIGLPPVIANLASAGPPEEPGAPSELTTPGSKERSDLPSGTPPGDLLRLPGGIPVDRIAADLSRNGLAVGGLPRGVVTAATVPAGVSADPAATGSPTAPAPAGYPDLAMGLLDGGATVLPAVEQAAPAGAGIADAGSTAVGGSTPGSTPDSGPGAGGVAAVAAGRGAGGGGGGGTGRTRAAAAESDGATRRAPGRSGPGDPAGMIPVPLPVPLVFPPDDESVPADVWTPPPGDSEVSGAPDARTPRAEVLDPESARMPVVSVPGLSATVRPAATPAPVTVTPPSTPTPVAAGTPVPGHTPAALADIVAIGMISAAAPSYIVGEVVNEDAILARTVLSGILAAVEAGAGGSSVVGVGWGVGVFRGVSGVGVFVCSNEGRGWLPAGLFLPVGVSVPWVWGVVGGVGLGWEGCGDAVRVLVEFARVWGPVAGSRLSAVVSSGPVDVGLAGLLGAGVSVEGFVGASGSGGLQLGVGGPGLVDRLGLVGAGVVGAGSVGAGGVDGVGWVEGVAEGELVSGCVGLGWDVHVRVGGLGVLEAVAVRGVRERVLVGLRSGTPVSDVLWDELRDEDVLLGVLVGSLRVDVSDVGLGELRFDDVGSRRLRGLVFERRCSEVVLLMRGGCSRQVLRDVVYAVGQVLDHPLFDTDLAAAGIPDIGNAGK